MKPIFTIQKAGDLYAVRSVGLDIDTCTEPRGACGIRCGFAPHRPPPGSWVLQGPTASALYPALTGHRYEHDPSTAHPDLARAYRAYIQRLAHTCPVLRDRRPCKYSAWLLAYAVVRHFGPVIQPWLGLMRLGPDRKLITDDPIYQERIPL